MKIKFKVIICILFALLYSTCIVADTNNGKYLFAVMGCASCHLNKNNNDFTGGTEIKTKYGTFYAPNITPDKNHGIGSWSESDFSNAIKKGINPKGKPYYPVFPYTHYSIITDLQITSLYNYLMSLKPTLYKNKQHDLKFPYKIREIIWLWRFFNFKEKYFMAPYTERKYIRGQILVTLGHCSMCHTPTNFLGSPKINYFFKGDKNNFNSPDITSTNKKGVGNWTRNDISWLLKTTLLPNGDTVDKKMLDVIEHGTSKLFEEDRLAIADYLLSLK